MAERSTARSADGAAQDHDNPASLIDSWIGRRSRLEASESDSSYVQQGAAAPQWREDVSDQYQESRQPENTGEHQGRPARQRAYPQYGDEYEQCAGARSQHEHPQRRSGPLAYQYAEHDQAYRGECRAQEPYGPTDASSVHEDAYAAQQERYAHETGNAHEDYYPHADSACRSEYRREESDALGLEAGEGGRPRRTYNRELGAGLRPASRRRRWLIPVGALAVGALLAALALTWESGRTPESGLPVSAATTAPDPFEEPVTPGEIPSMSPSSAAPGGSSAPPSATPSARPSVTPSATPSVTPSATPTPTAATPTQTRSPNPVLLGPSSSRGVANMAQRYCDRYTGGSADPRNDGRWQCTRLLSASIVDMDVACRDTFESGAYAQTSNSGDPYAWRCYR
ncbi:SPOR domain-containing protein [Micromonospora sp. L32]|uniref:SPOR domain-containing protein n=1 Tax=Micromonospora TaxID=1873 RepID=UPI003F8B8686